MRRAAALVLLLAAAPAFAWGEKGHTITNEAAVRTLPTDLPPFFLKAFPDLVYLAAEPDRWKGGGESIDAANSPDHFLDFEYVRGLALPRDRYAFIALLGTSGTLRRHGIANSTPGFLPWRIAELYERLVIDFRRWRGIPAGSPDRAHLEHEIVETAGILSHFVGDAANPLHATYNFNGWVDTNPRRYRNDCDVHVRFETNFINVAVETADVLPLVAQPQLRTDAFTTALDLIKESNAEVEPLYAIDREREFKTHTPRAKAFVAARLARGASLLRDLWWSAWRASELSDSTGRRQRRGGGSQSEPPRKGSPTGG